MDPQGGTIEICRRQLNPHATNLATPAGMPVCRRLRLRRSSCTYKSLLCVQRCRQSKCLATTAGTDSAEIPRRLGGQVRRHLSWLDGQVHSRFAFRVELASLLSDRRLYRFPRSIRAIAGSCVHTVGNGLFFDRTRLDDLGGLPEVVDDLALGWRATAIGERVEPIRSVVFYDAYPSLADARRSRAFICSGYLRAIADIHRAPDRVGAALPIHICRLYYRLLEWTFGPFTRSVAFVLCLDTWIRDGRCLATTVCAVCPRHIPSPSGVESTRAADPSRTALHVLYAGHKSRRAVLARSGRASCARPQSPNHAQ